MSLFESVAVLVSVLAIWLTTRRSLWCWPLGLIACAMYFKLFLDVRLYADMLLQLLFGLSILYGWFAWRRGAAVDGEVTIRQLSRREAAAGLAAGTIAAGAIGWLMQRYTDAALPWLDAALSSFSLVAQLWTARRYPANWLLWIAVDTIYVGMFLFKRLWLTAGLYAALTVLAALGFMRWRQGARAARGRAKPA